MTDLLARLRAVNPVPTCDRPMVEDVWRKLEQQNQVPGRNTPRPERPGLKGQRDRSHVFSRVSLRVRHVGLGLAVAVPLLVAALAIVLLGHNQNRQPASQSRPAHPKPALTPLASIDAALARGVHPPAPDANMALPILDSSETQTLHGYRGKVVVLNVFASWCDPCKAETTALQQAQARIAGKGATVLGVTYLDKPADAEAFVRSEHINYPVVRDVTANFARAYGANGIPETFVIDRDGRIAAVRRYQVSARWLEQTLARVLRSGG